MPPGDQIEQNYQTEIRAWLAGPGTNTRVRGLDGLLNQSTKTADLDLIGDGIDAGIDYLASDAKAIEYQFVEYSTPEALQALLADFMDAWVLGGDEEFHFQLGGTHYYLVGRTRDYRVDVDNAVNGVIDVVAQFVPTDPTIHVVGS